jgi:hypothetical protein
MGEGYLLGSSQDRETMEAEVLIMGNGMARVTELAEVSWMVDPIEVVSYEKLVDFEEGGE